MTTNQSSGIGNHSAAPWFGGIMVYHPVIIPIVYGIISLIGLTGNSLVIYVVMKYARVKSVTYLYILNLALADELFVLLLPLSAASIGLETWPFGTVMCKIALYVDTLNQFVSIFCLTVLSVDRFVAVACPVISVNRRNTRMARTVNISVWAISLVVSSPVVIFANTDTAEQHETHLITCNLHWPEHVSSTMGEAWVIYTFTLGFAVPLIVIVTCYSLMTRRLCDSVKGTSTTVQRNQSRRHREKAIKKVERLVAVVVTVFVICWLPFYIFQIANLSNAFSGMELDTAAGLFYFTITLSYANSCCNPVLYAFFDENFKKSFQEALKFRPKIRFTKNLGPSQAYNTFYSRRTELVTMTVKSTVPMTTGDHTRMDTLKLPNCVPTPEMSKHYGQEQSGPSARKHFQQQIYDAAGSSDM
uniref:G-protein coupled receptors family 1 profile domain-containing protein n=1 Tax=Branchiostoma floridae TaxID=7739 RepID=C3ZMP4_BRAFL|eukprot:XP_002590140.1 hypothetical protein BRAFLDRAFT_90874 [Branchiostoma floridae]